jgi:hypothetical protein
LLAVPSWAQDPPFVPGIWAGGALATLGIIITVAAFVSIYRHKRWRDMAIPPQAARTVIGGGAASITSAGDINARDIQISIGTTPPPPELDENEMIHEGVVWRDEHLDLRGPFCPVHRGPLFYKSFLGNVEHELGDELYLGSHGFLFCPSDATEEFRMWGGIALQIGHVKKRVAALFRDRRAGIPTRPVLSFGPPPASEPFNVSIRPTRRAIAVNFAPSSVLFLTFPVVEIVNRMQRGCLLNLNLRLRMRQGGWLPLPRTVLPDTDKLPSDVGLGRPPLGLLSVITLFSAGMPFSTFSGHVSFALEPVHQALVLSGGSLDSLASENVNFELRDTATEDVRICAIDVEWLSWRRISL